MPHRVNIQFHKKTAVQEIALYTDYRLDESYTPSKISIRAGTCLHDLQEVRTVDLEEPTGWVNVTLSPSKRQDAHFRTFFLQLGILANHQNGRDTHIRQIKVFSPRQVMTSGQQKMLFTSDEFNQYVSIR